eukprot:scaffold198473_cov29-Prasinocladus_malaysianus.AAC.1
MQFGSSSQAVFFKMRVAGVLHIFQFETKQGEDICMALQTHINDIMMKRYSKAKALAAAEGKGGSGDKNDASSALPQANPGPKYEAHVGQLQKKLEDANKKCDEIQKRENSLQEQKARVESELEDLRDRVGHLEEARAAHEEQSTELQAEVDRLKDELAAAESLYAKLKKVSMRGMREFDKGFGVEVAVKDLVGPAPSLGQPGLVAPGILACLAISY